MPRKVFELAKDLGMGPLDLVESLKSKGFAIRNHMAELSDEEVEKVLADFNKAKEAEAVAEAPKKKAVRKKVKEEPQQTVATKEVASEAEAPMAVSAQVVEEKATAQASVVRKKASVIRKKSDDHSDEQHDDKDVHVSETKTQTTQVMSKTLEESSLSFEEHPKTTSSAQPQSKVGGLRVVSKPKIEERVILDENTDEDVVDTAPQRSTDKSKELYQEKVHRFTPVFTPSKDAPKDESSQSARPKTAASAPRTTGTAIDPFEDAETKKKREDEEESRKRMGGLASMMSGKKVVSKSQVLNISRAEDELKSYLTLSGTGRPIYSTVKRKKDYSGPIKETEVTQVKESKRVVQIHKGATCSDFAQKLSLKFRDFADECLKLNLLVKENDYVGTTLAREIAALWNYRVEDIAFDESKIINKSADASAEKSNLPHRPPVVAIMGHVDHGKTTLLDTVRKAKVADGEAGGITQHIGAYSVKTNNGQSIAFLDTPGHAAFASMRQRGANVTDIVILVVAADDGVMPQTRESIKYCENAGVPIIVAVNKMDKPGVNPDRIKQELSDYNLMPEEWGGQTQYVHVSALKGQGIDELLEAILLQAEILDLRANPKGVVDAVVIESKIEPGRGPMATVLVQSGTLNKGDCIVVGETNGRARSLTDHLGKNLDSAGPSTPVQIFGLEQAPSPGDKLNVVKNEREAKKIAENRISERKALEAVPEKKKMSLEDFFAGASNSDQPEKKILNLIIRSDVNGSYEAIKQALEALGNNEVAVKVVAGGVGPITDSDVLMAQTTGGYIIGFNMRPVTSARKLAEDKGIDIKNYSIIYELINDIKLALEGLLDPEEVEEYIGRAEVREVFNIPKAGVIAGSYVIEGKIAQGCGIRLLRNGKIVHDGKLSSLKRFKDDAKEVKNGYECGIALENFDDIRQADIFEAYMMIKKKRTLDDAKSLSHGGSSNEARM